MKKFLFFLALAAGILTVSCNKERFPYEKGELPSGTQFFFPVGTETKYKLAEEMTGIDFTVKRVVKDAAKSIQIAVTDTSKTVFASGTGTLTAAFAAGSDAATITLPIDYAKYEYGDLFGLDFKINEETTPYAPSSLHFEIELPEPWKSLGMALYRDNIIAGYYNFEPIEYEVELLENELYPGYYRLVNPYGAAFPKNDDGDYDTDKDYYMEIHAEDPTAVWIPVRKSNIHWSDGYFYMGSIAGYYIEYGGSTLAEQKAKGNTGTLENGIITFPANTLLVGEENYNGGNLYTTNAAGMFRIAFPGVVPADYTCELAYSGLFTDKEGEVFAVADVTLEGADIASAKAVIVPGNIAEDEDVETAALELINSTEESDYVVEVKESGEIRLPLPKTDEFYSIVLVPFDEDKKAHLDFGYADIFQYKDFGITVKLADPETLDEEKASITATIGFGEDTEGAAVVFGKGKTSDELRAALQLILNADPSVQWLDAPGQVSFEFPTEEGDYFVLAASIAESSLWNLDYKFFEYTKVNPWEPMGYINYTDQIIAPVYQLPAVSYYVPIEKNTLKEGLYRLVNPYLEAFPYNEPGDYDASGTNYYIQIDAQDPDIVVIPQQEAGVDWGYGIMSVGSLGWYYLSAGYSYDVIVANVGDIFGKLADNKISFPAKALYMWDEDNKPYSAAGALVLDLSAVVAEKPAGLSTSYKKNSAKKQHVAPVKEINAEPILNKTLKPSAVSVHRGLLSAKSGQKGHAMAF